MTQNGAHRVTASYSKYVSRVADGISTANAAGGSPATIYYAYQGPSINPAGTPADSLVDTATALQMVHDWLVGFCGGELSATNPCLKDIWLPGGNSVPGYSARSANSVRRTRARSPSATARSGSRPSTPASTSSARLAEFYSPGSTARTPK